MDKEIIKFPEPKTYVKLKDLNNGSTGKTILMRDEAIGEDFVCKKYETEYPEYQQKYFSNFVDEIKILYQINHPNIVRVFSYYLYPNRVTGFIIMEYIDGDSIDEFIKDNPSQINSVFEQTINGFKYLNQRGILHRDIRPSNILINNNREVKIIDFGFGKQAIFGEADISKSISLNWICGTETPSEFDDKIYDYKTEVYFIGVLFQLIINTYNLNTEFKYNEILELMVQRDYCNRIDSFEFVAEGMNEKNAKLIQFSDIEMGIYQKFANALSSVCAAFYESTVICSDVNKISEQLNELERNTSLEKSIYPPLLIDCFILGDYKYFENELVHTSIIKAFNKWWNTLSDEKRLVVLDNIKSRLARIKRLPDEPDDLPF